LELPVFSRWFGELEILNFYRPRVISHIAL
jgi:hypothetical protein